ncbi:MAG: Rieske 2Fe-2S domain-containing protein, partial [Pseudomonadota bacterium]
LASVLSAYPAGAGDDTLAFQIFGLFALTILLMMAATSHDFWLANLSAPVWKTLHMLVYFAYAAVIVHVAFGAMQDQGLVPLAALLVLSAVLLTSLHLAAGWKDRVRASSGTDGWVAAGDAKTIPDGRARVVLAAGERVAVFRFGSEIMALSAICQHQNGPLGEGCIIDGLVTCPWHGYQYDPRTGASPPPYTEQIPTFDVRLQGTQAWISAVPNPLGSEAQTASLPASEEAADG